MPCTNTPYASLVVVAAPVWRRSRFMQTMLVVLGAFQEALEMQRATRPRYPLNDE